MIGDALPARAKQLGEQGVARLREKLAGHPDLVEVRGLGLMVGIELKSQVSDIVARAQQNGLLLITAGPNVIRLVPPLTIAEEDWNRGLDLLAGIIAGAKNGIYA
jgi:acetylornithine/N-succinyldiaminopimelate aminotransferase